MRDLKEKQYEWPSSDDIVEGHGRSQAIYIGKSIKTLGGILHDLAIVIQEQNVPKPQVFHTTCDGKDILVSEVAAISPAIWEENPHMYNYTILTKSGIQISAGGNMTSDVVSKCRNELVGKFKNLSK